MRDLNFSAGCRFFNKYFFCLIFVFTILFSFTTVVSAEGEINENKTPATLIDRMKLVLKFGHSQQVRDVLKKVPELKPEEQKLLIDDLKLLLATRDNLVKISMVGLVSSATWNDLDEEILVYFSTENSDLFISLMTAVRKKNIHKAEELIEKKILESDFSKSDNSLLEMIDVMAYFKNSNVSDFLFVQLKDDKVDRIYKSPILRYFGVLPSLTQDKIDFMIQAFQSDDFDMGMRSMSVYALGKQKVIIARDPMKEILNKIDDFSDLDKKKEYFDLRLYLISSLIMMGDSDVRQILVEMTKDDDDRVRRRAVRQLGEIGSDEYIGLLEYKQKFDSSSLVQKEAKDAIEKIKGTNEGNVKK